MNWLLLYIDPGTGSMLFAILVGVLGALVFALRSALVKFKVLFSAGSKNKISKRHIPLVLFAESKRYFNVFEPILRELEAREINTVYYTESEDDPAFQQNYTYIHPEFIGTGNSVFAKLNMLEADVFLATTPGLDVYQWKRSKTVKYYIHIPHACSDITLYRIYGIDYYDAILLTGDYEISQVRALEKARNLPEKECKVVGVPYFDAMLERLERTPKLLNEETCVLLAPSWGPSAILSKYGEKMIQALIDTGYRVIIRPHPQSFSAEKDMIESLMAQFPETPLLEWNRDSDNFDALNRASIMISDFSGVIFDFSLAFDKPVIYADTSFDDSVYDAHWIDEPLWTFETMPKIGTELTEESISDIKSVIDEALASEKGRDAREQARKETWANIGSSGKVIADYLETKLKEYAEPNDSAASKGGKKK